MDNYSLIILICTVVASLAFTFLVIFLITMLVSLTKTLNRASVVLEDVEQKLALLTPLFVLVAKVGNFADNCVSFFSEEDEEEQESCKCPKKRKRGEGPTAIGALLNTAQWALIAINFFGKKKKRSWWGD
jgi:uncharacterized protein YoxC